MSSKEVIILHDVRLSFPDLWKPGKPPADKPNEPGKYGGQFIFAPGSPPEALVKQTMLRVAQQEFGTNWQNVMRAMDKKNKCLRVGDDNLDKSGAVRDGYEGMLYVPARNVNKPMIVDRFRNKDGQPIILTQETGRPYGGCYVNAKLEIIAMKAFEKVPNQVYAKLLSIQYFREGDPFSGAPATADGFDFDDADGAPEVGGGDDDLFS
jgi:hypothetical protein